MKILAIGGGSMGRRRLRDLTYLNEGEVLLFEPMEERCRETAAAFGVRGFTDWDEALAQQPDVLSISTPPALHEPYVRQGMVHGLHVFAEVPFVLDAAALEEIAGQAQGYQGVLGVSHTARYYPPLRLIHDVLQNDTIGKPLYFEYSLGNYLPDWHPYEDYRKFYASDARLGGAGMDMLLHEINAIRWWMGEISSVYARLSKVSALEINGPDNHDVLCTFANGARGFFHHDVIERGTVGRHIRIAGELGTLEWHQNLPSIRVYHDGANHELGFEEASDWESAVQASREMTEILARQSARSGHIPSAAVSEFVYDSCYLREMRHFLGAARGEHPYSMATIADELQTVRIFHTLLRSDEERRELPVMAPTNDAAGGANAA
jgi:predicted dehydrogenase